MRTHHLILLAIAASVVVAPMGLGQGVAPNAVINGDFELDLPDEPAAPLRGTPADTCLGIGHQVFYGTETYQHDLLDKNDPAAAMERDPAYQAELATGYGHCVYSDQEGVDVAWLNAVDTAQDDAVQWSGHADDIIADIDGDGDKEAGIVSGSGHHNLWQTIAQPFQAFTANFEAFEFDVEAGSIHHNAKVILSLSATPMEVQSPWVGLYLDCQLSFDVGELTMDANGHVAVDPTDGRFTSRSVDCDQAKADWDAAKSDGDQATQRSVLGQLRLVQMSFWGFERAPADPGCGCAIQIDNVAISQPTSVAEEAAAGNVDLRPAPSLDE